MAAGVLSSDKLLRVAMPDDDPIQSLHAVVNCYLTTLEVVANTVADACPPIGGPYRQRLSRLRARLAFDSSVDAIEESSGVIARELEEYASKASGYLERHGAELRQAVAGLEEIVRTLAQRQEFYGERLRRFATQMEAAGYPADRDGLAELVELQAANLLNCVESMSHESQSLLKRMRDQMTAVGTRLAEAEITDPLTGLMNRREMERRIAAASSGGVPPVLLLFDFDSGLPNEIAQQIAARLVSQFRYNDTVARWSDRQFLVLFQGRPETARIRLEQVVPWISGRYLLDIGEATEVTVDARLVDANQILGAELAAVHE